MKCPGCDHHFKLETFYKKFWYELDSGCTRCPACDREIPLVWTMSFRLRYAAGFILTMAGMIVLLALRGDEPPYVVYAAIATLFTGGAFVIDTKLRPGYGVAPGSSPVSGTSDVSPKYAWGSNMMNCPGCGKQIQPVMRYLGSKRWYQFARAAAFCPKCNGRLVLIWTKRFRFLYTLAVVLTIAGVTTLILTLNRDTHHLWRAGAVALFAGGFCFMLAMANRKLGVARQADPKSGA